MSTKKELMLRKRNTFLGGLILCICLFMSNAEAVRFPLKISSNGRYLVDQDNVPFLYTGDTAWRLFLGATREEAEMFMNDRLSKKYNTIQVILLPWNDNDMNQYGQKAFDPPGILSSPNPAYFDQVDWVINKAAEKGMLAVVVVAWLRNYKVNFQTQGTNACRALGRFVGNRYKNFDNILWVMGGDDAGVDPYMIYEREIVAGIKENDTRHLVTYHNGDGPSQFPAESWVDLWSNYTYGGPPYNGSYAYDVALEHYHRTPVRPSIFTEGYYDGAWGEASYDASRTRAQAWEHMLSGGAGQAVGANGVWYVGGNWKDNLQTAGIGDMAHLYNLLGSRRWYHLIPDDAHKLLTAGYGTFGQGTYVTAAKTADGTLALAYVPPTGTGSTSITVDMSQLTSTLLCNWYNPSNGAFTPIGSFPASGSRVFTTPGTNGDGSNDWVLIMENGGGIAANLNASPVSGALPLTVNFDASSSYGESISYAWNFGDGQSGNGKTLSHTFTNAGTYTAILTITSGQLVDRDTVTITAIDALKEPLKISCNAPVTASSAESGVVGAYPASNAVDCNPTTRWGSNATDNEWIFINLGSIQSFQRVILRWEAAFGSSYKIQVSDNATSWADIAAITNGNGGIDTISVNGRGRYVRMQGLTRATQYGYSLYEFEVYQMPLPTYSLKPQMSEATPFAKKSEIGYYSITGKRLHASAKACNVQVLCIQEHSDQAKNRTAVRFGKPAQ